MKHPNPDKMAADIGEDARDLVGLLKEATAVQWNRSRTVSTVEEPSIRSKGGGPARPTEDAALDPVRLALRDEVKHSARLLVKAHRDLWKARQRLSNALEAWRGDGLTNP